MQGKLSRLKSDADESGYAQRVLARKHYPVVDNCQIPYLDFIYRKYFHFRRSGIYVEVGAYDGLSFSNTWGLALAGWRGLLVEPIPEYAAKCKNVYKDLHNISVHNCAISSSDRGISLQVQGALSTSSPELSELYDTLPWANAESKTGVCIAPSCTLDAFLNDNGVTPSFDLLVVDVEGHEGQVFEGFSLNFWRPSMIIIELADLHPDIGLHAVEHRQLAKSISQTGYNIVYKDHINTIFVHGSID